MNKKLKILTFGVLPAVVASAALVSACSGRSNDGAPPPTGTESDDLYAAKQLMWPLGNVDVCFMSSSAVDGPHWRNIVQSWVTSSWQSNADITFHGWGTCGAADGPTDGIQIVFQDVGPHTTGFGTQLIGQSPGMFLNNVYSAVGRGPYAVDSLLGWVAVHEFGHALGFPHEQDRPDTLSSVSSTALATADPYCGSPGTCSELMCVQSYLGGIDGGMLANGGLPTSSMIWYDEALPRGALTPIGFYDHISVMNYCSTAGRYANSGVLSPDDLAAVQKLYGVPMGPPFGSAPINQSANPVSSDVPRSTVNLQTPANLSPSCTGVILSSTATGFKVLTAAHCKVDSTTTVQFYSTSVAGGAGGTGPVLTASSSTPVAVPAFTGPCDPNAPDAPTSFPSSCVVTGSDGSSYYADLAVLTVDSPLPSGYVAAPLGARGSLSAGVTLTADDAGLPGSMWEVGTGWGVIPPISAGGWGPLGTMQWGPAYPLPSGDDPATPGMVNDVSGYFQLTAPFTQRGDLGGPAFEEVAAPLTSPNGLVLMGITMTAGLCTDPATCSFSSSSYNNYTSVVYPQNYDWLLGYGALPAPSAPAPGSGDTDGDGTGDGTGDTPGDVGTFGASQ